MKRRWHLFLCWWKHDWEHDGGNTGLLACFEKKKSNNHRMTFSREKVDQPLLKGAIYPIFGAMRYLIKENRDGEFVWKLGSLEATKKFYDQVAPELIQETKTAFNINGNHPDAVGKSLSHWSSLYQQVRSSYIESHSRN